MASAVSGFPEPAITNPDPRCPELTLIGALFTSACNWRVADLGWIYTRNSLPIFG